MSQKSEKYARSLLRRQEAVERRVAQAEDTMVRWEDTMRDMRLRAVEDAWREKAAARRRTREAERKARTWKHIAYAALVAAIIVEIIAIWAVRYKEPEVPPLVVLPEEQVVVVKQIGAPTIAQLIG